MLTSLAGGTPLLRLREGEEDGQHQGVGREEGNIISTVAGGG